MKRILFLLLCISALQASGFAQTVYDDDYKENPSYLKGMEYLDKFQYSSAINEFKKALRENPKDESALIGLSNAYNLRAQYYSANSQDREKAVSDIKSALFFNKYYRQELSGSSAQAVMQMEKNLKMLEPVLSISETAKKAKQERAKGDFAAAGYDYFKLINIPEYKEEAASALGDIYKIFNRPDKSITFYQTALSAKPDNAENHLKLARVYEDMNDYASSLKEYTYALNSSSEREDILASLERIWQKKADENPKDAEARANLGVIYQKQKRYNEAIAEYKKAEALNPENINIKLNIGTLYQEQQRYDAALDVYNSVLQTRPQDINVILYRAQCLKALNRKDAAIDAYKTVLQLDSKNKTARAELFSLLKDTMTTEDMLAYLYQNVLNTPADASVYYEFAYELHKAGKIDDAIRYYEQALKLDNTNADAYVNLAQCWRQKKNYAEAEKVLKAAAAASPDNQLVKKQIETLKNEYSSIIYNTAAGYFESGSYEAAIEMYSKIQPPSAEADIGIAASYHALGNDVKALEYYRYAAALDSKNADIPYYIAAIYANSGDMQLAGKYAEEALQKNPKHVQAKELAAYISSKNVENMLENAVKVYEEENYTQAASMFSGIIKINPNNASAYYYRALCSDALKNWQKAVSDYETAVKLSPDMNIAYYSIAVDYDNLGKYKQAKEFYKKYAEIITDDNEYKQYALTRIKELESSN